jgi:hypothetical protein
MLLVQALISGARGPGLQIFSMIQPIFALSLRPGINDSILLVDYNPSSCLINFCSIVLRPVLDIRRWFNRACCPTTALHDVAGAGATRSRFWQLDNRAQPVRENVVCPGLQAIHDLPSSVHDRTSEMAQLPSSVLSKTILTRGSGARQRQG